MKYIYKFNTWLNETKIKDLFHPKVGIPVIFNAKDYPELANDFYELISIAYSELGGHTKINKPEDIFSSDWNFWEGIDIDNDED